MVPFNGNLRLSLFQHGAAALQLARTNTQILLSSTNGTVGLQVPARPLLASEVHLFHLRQLTRRLSRGEVWTLDWRCGHPSLRSVLYGHAESALLAIALDLISQDNIFYSAGSITAAVKRARSVAGFSLKIEVECSSQKDAEEAIEV